MMTNRYQYVGSKSLKYSDTIKKLFNDNGNSINGDNPYHNAKLFMDGMNNATKFAYDHFINNVEVPEWMIVNHGNLFLYDPEQDVWIMVNHVKPSGIHLFV